jgi:DNA-binding HxlR family transcriptional regulator
VFLLYFYYAPSIYHSKVGSLKWYSIQKDIKGGINMSECKVETALEILTGKWKPKILFQLLNHKTMRFNELMRRIPGVTQRMLTQHLRELEEQDIVTRTVYAEVPPKVEYSISDYGSTLVPVLQTMDEWGRKHAAHIQKKNERN